MCTASQPSTSSDGSASAKPRRWASASALSKVTPALRICVRMTLVVPLMTQSSAEMRSPSRLSRSNAMIGSPAPTVGLEIQPGAVLGGERAEPRAGRGDHRFVGGHHRLAGAQCRFDQRRSRDRCHRSPRRRSRPPGRRPRPRDRRPARRSSDRCRGNARCRAPRRSAARVSHRRARRATPTRR